MKLKEAKQLLTNVSINEHSEFLDAEWPAILSHAEVGYRMDGILNKISFAKQKKLVQQIDDKYKKARTSAPFKDPKNPKFKYIDLFAGIGGFRLALRSAGGGCVFSSEWDKPAQDTYFRNYGEIPFGDIRQFTGEDVSNSMLDKLIPDHDILAAGFPCQPFSRAGVSARNSLKQKHGFNCSSQGTLFYDVARIATVKKPKVLFLENVKNLQSHDGGRTFEIIKQTIEQIGYHFSYALINAQSLVPQKRVRCYMVAIRKDFDPFTFDMSDFEGEPIPLKTILETGSIVKEYQISQKLWDGHINRTKRNIERGTGFTALEADINKPANTLVARYGKDGKECLIPMKDGPPRKLTRREAARLQGYPEKFILPDSKTPTYKQMGNSVAVPVVSKIAKQIVKHIGNCDGL